MAKLDLKQGASNLLFLIIVTVSRKFSREVKKVFPDLESKIISIENIISKILVNLATKNKLTLFKRKFHCLCLGE